MRRIAATLTALSIMLASAAPAAQATRFGFTEEKVCKVNRKGVEKCKMHRTRTRFG